MRSSMAENHPVGFQWVVEAREKGAKVIHVDPRFTRTSAMADIWVPLRAGSDVLFLGALIRYVLENNSNSATTPSTRPTRPLSCARTAGTRKISTGCFPAGTGRRKSIIPRLGSTREQRSMSGTSTINQDRQTSAAVMAKIEAEKRKIRANMRKIALLSIPAACFRY